MSKIDIGLRLPESVLEDVTAIVGRRGRGKTNTATVMVEEAHAVGMRFCVADPVGVWHGLRSSRDGKAPGIPVVVMGGEHAMVPLEPASGKIIADFLAAPGPSVVLDFRLMRKAEITRFMADFLERLYFKNRESLLLVLDEADKFAPQRPFGDEARMLGACEDVVKMGRARGLHSILITQRPATLNKNVITQAGMLIAHGLPAPQDQKAIDAWIQERADEEHRAEFLETLGGLARGEAWVWAPELEIFKRVQIRERKTFDSSATPKRGETRRDPKVLAEVDLEKLSAEIKATAERVKATDPKELQKRLAEANAALAQKERLIAQIDEQTKRIDAKLERIKPVEKLILKDAQIARLEKIVERFRGGWDWHRERLVLVQAEIDRLNAVSQAAFNEIVAALKAASKPVPQSAVVGGGTGAVTPRRPAPVVSTAPADSTLGKDGRRRILIALAQYPDGLSDRKLSILTDIAKHGGTWRTYMAALRGAGWISGDRARFTITEAGLKALGSYEPLPTGPALVDYWRGRLGDTGKRRIFDAVVAVYPGEIHKEEVSRATNIETGGGTWRTYMAELRGLGLIEGKESLRASEELFS